MSTYWGYKCLDCDEESERWFNRGQTQLNEYFEAHQLIKDKGFKWIEIRVMGLGYDSGAMGEFLENHEGHRVVLHNEYNQDEELRYSLQKDETRADGNP